ncbi:MAG: AprI/Inh family metalloprotease inhibitor [Pseudomonadota bacterium]
MQLSGFGLRISMLVAVLALAACSGDRVSDFSLPGMGSTPAPPSPAAAPAANLAGRWMLAQPGRGQCVMTFGAQPGATEGTIAPQGGCPGKFFTSRKWTSDTSGLVIRDHNSEPLAQLSSKDGGRFEGQSSTGEPITLSR